MAARLTTIDADRAAQEVHDIEHTARTALTEVRAAVTGYRATGLGGELANARRVLAAAGVDTERDGPARTAGRTGVGPGIRRAGIGDERGAPRPTHRHASIRIDSTTEDGWSEVSDDGRGGHTPDGAGLTGMRERISALGGGVTRGTAQTTARARWSG